jgi:hypothetical protein
MDWVLAVERAYVASATGGASPGRSGANPARANLARARAALGAVASRYLAVGTPRTFGLVADATTLDEAALSVVAHRTWFQPRELRCAELPALAELTGGASVALGEALACDIVCVHAPIALGAAQLRRGTHVNLLCPAATLDAELRALAAVSDEARDLGALAAGLIDGRQLDELTVFVIGDAQLALAALDA